MGPTVTEWTTDGVVSGVVGGPDGSLTVNGQACTDVQFIDAHTVRVFTPPLFLAPCPWALSAAPTTFTVTPPLAVPESGTVS
jgi:hypothetical protein